MTNNTTDKKIYAVIVAAGSGTRMGASVPKQLLPLDGSTVLECAAIPFIRNESIDGIVVVTPAGGEFADEFEAAVSRLRRYGDKPVETTTGGSDRAGSVRNGLAKVASMTGTSFDPDTAEAAAKDEEDILVLIHDAARAFVTQDIIDRNIDALSEFDAVCTAVPSVDSIRVIPENLLSSQTIYPIIDSKVHDRRAVYRVQTPQSFKLSGILRAHALAERDGYAATDDASVAEYAGMEVAIVEGDPANIKITTDKDLPMSTRVGTGYDVHRLVPDRELILCGTPVPSKLGLLGHSDADVATHAVIDALLGAAGKGDIGTHFPDTDEKYKGADSIELLKQAMEIAGDIRIVNVDVTIIAEKPKLAPYIGSMTENLSVALGIPESAVNVKATTTEKLGFTGREEGIAALATCSIEGRFI